MPDICHHAIYLYVNKYIKALMLMNGLTPGHKQQTSNVDIYIFIALNAGVFMQ